MTFSNYDSFEHEQHTGESATLETPEVQPVISCSDAIELENIHTFFLLDVSGSMSGASIVALNNAVPNVLEVLEEQRHRKNELIVITHILSFNNEVTWRCGTSAEKGICAGEALSQWQDLQAGGGTNTAAAIHAILPGLSTRYLGKRTLRPIIILISDGESNEPNKTLEAIDKLDHRQKALRVAIGMGGYNCVELEAFASTAHYMEEDDMGNMSEPTRRKLVFPVSDVKNLGTLVKTTVATSLIVSMSIRREQAKDPDATTHTIWDEDDVPFCIFPVDPEE